MIPTTEPFGVLLNLVALICVSIFFGVIGEGIALKKGRTEKEGFYLGFFLHFLGLFIEYLLPRQNKD